MRASSRLAMIIAAFTMLAPDCFGAPPDCESGDPAPPYSVSGSLAPLAQTTPDSCEPPPPCDNCGSGSLDPHLRTFDGKFYDYQGAVEAVAARAPDGSFEVQWRMEPVYDSTRASGITGVAVKVGLSRVTFLGDGNVLRVDGGIVDLQQGDNLHLMSGATLHGDRGLVMIQSADRTASVQISTWDPQMLGVIVDPPDAFLGEMRGLLGDADGDPDNDIMHADGTPFEDTSFESIYPGLGEEWRVSDDTTLFDYADGEGPDTYWDPTFPVAEVRLDDFTAEERAAAEAICREAGVSEEQVLADCIFDVLVTGDPTLAETAAAFQLALGLDLGTGVGPVEFDEIDTLWDTVIGDGLDSDIGDRPLAIDGEGHLLVQVSGTGTQELVAVDQTDGSIAWRLADVDAGCGVAVTDDGRIIAQLAAHSDTADGPSADVVVIDPSSGELIEGLRFTAPDIQAQSTDLNGCRNAIQYANGRIVLLESYAHVSGRLWSFTLTEDAIEFDWSEDVAVTWAPFDTPILSPDGTSVYIARGGMQALGEPYGIDRYNAATGSVESSSADLGNDPRAQPVLVGDDIVVSVADAAPDDRDALIRLDGDSLDVDWRLDFTDGLTLDEQSIGRFSHQSMAVVNGQLVGYQSDCCVTAVDAASGTLLWTHRNHLGGIVPWGLVVDPAGTAYLSSNGDFAIQAVAADGSAAGDVDDEAFKSSFGAVARLGPATGNVIYALAQSEDRQQLHLLAISLN